MDHDLQIDNRTKLTTSISTLRQRYLVRRDAPVWPFVWRGLLPLLGLLLLALFAFMPFAKRDIEANVLRETRDQLSQRGMAWVDVKVSGQNVTLSGTQPTAGAGDAAKALALAREATCPSWVGRTTCAVSVTADFAEPTAKAPAPVAQPKAVAEACERSLVNLLTKSTLEFETGKAIVLSRSDPLLDKIAQAIESCAGTIRVEGHTDSVGDAAKNQALSQARAQAVRAALQARKVPESRMVAQGFGDTRPIADNTDAGGRARNRRIEFRVAVSQ